MFIDLREEGSERNIGFLCGSPNQEWNSQPNWEEFSTFLVHQTMLQPTEPPRKGHKISMLT